MSIEQILEQNYSKEFDKIRQNMMVVSHYKYGPLKENYKVHKCIDCIGSLKKRLKAYEDTGNTEFLADIANFAMIEFMLPQHAKAHYKSTDSDESPGLEGFSINEIKDFDS